MYKTDIDLINKCGSCEYASDCYSPTKRSMCTTVKCMNPNKHFRNPWNQIKARSRDACPKYAMRCSEVLDK